MFCAEFNLVEVVPGREATLIRLRPPADRAVAVARVVLHATPEGIPCVLSSRAGGIGGESTQRARVLSTADGVASRTAAEVGWRRMPQAAARIGGAVLRSAARLEWVGDVGPVRLRRAGAPIFLTLSADRRLYVRGVVHFEEVEVAAAAMVATSRGHVQVGSPAPIPIAGWSATIGPMDEAEGLVPADLDARVADLMRRYGVSERVARGAAGLIAAEASRGASPSARARASLPPEPRGGPPTPMPELFDARGRRAIVPPDILAHYRSGRLTLADVLELMGLPEPAAPGPEAPRPRRRVVRPSQAGEGGI